MDRSPVLEVQRLSKHFGGLKALADVDLAVQKGEFLGIIGPNGAGKTTLFNVITGVYPATNGEVLLQGERISHFKTYERARRGIVRCFQQANIFSSLTVIDNLVQSFHTRMAIGFWGGLFDNRKARQKIGEAKVQAIELLRGLGMERFKNDISGALPLGIQKKLGIAMALAVNPKVLLLDEPVSGLNPVEVEGVMLFVNQYVRNRCTCIIIEHHVKTVMHHCDRIMVLQFGRKIAEGLPAEIRQNRDVITAYLGEEAC